MKTIIFFFVKALNLVVIILLFSVVIHAQDNSKGFASVTENLAKSGTVRAVIVGVSHYKNIQSLEYANKDAISFYDYLRSSAGGNIDSNNIKLLTNEKATAAQIFGALGKPVQGRRCCYFLFLRAR